jgi:flagellar biogenesis protein FliO
MVVCALAAWQPSLSLVAEAAQGAAEVGGAGPAAHAGYGDLLMMSLGLLAVIGVLAVAAVKLLGAGRMGRRRGDLLEVIARQPLEPRRSLYVVRAGTRTLLVGTSELGVTMLTELEGVDRGVDRGVDGRVDRVAGGDGLVGSSRPHAPGAMGFAELVREATRRWSGRKADKAAPPVGEGSGRGGADADPPELGPS